MTTKTLREVRFTFDDEQSFDGLTDDTFWNGFLNVRVTPAVRDQIIESFRASGEPEVEEDFNSIPVVDGMVDLSGGFATMEWMKPEPPCHVCGEIRDILDGGYVKTESGEVTCATCFWERLDQGQRDIARDDAVMGEGHDCWLNGTVEDFPDLDNPTCALCGLVLQ